MPQWDLTTPEIDSHGNSTGVVTIEKYVHEPAKNSVSIHYFVNDSTNPPDSTKGSKKHHLIWNALAGINSMDGAIPAGNDYTSFMGDPATTDLDDDEILLQKLADDGVIGAGSYAA